MFQIPPICYTFVSSTAFSGTACAPDQTVKEERKMKRWTKRLRSGACCLTAAAAILLAPLVSVLASGIPDIHSIIHSPTTPYTDSAWFSSGSLAPADW